MRTPSSSGLQRRPSRQQAELRADLRRRQAFDSAQAQLADAGIHVDLRPITDAALQALDHWTNRRVAWPWRDMADDYRRNHPARFDLAIWVGDVLCGLALGRPSKSSSHLALEYAERNPDPSNPAAGDVIPVVLTAANAYGAALGRRELRLVDPFPALIPHYCSPRFGFTLVAPQTEAPYCRRSI